MTAVPSAREVTTRDGVRIAFNHYAAPGRDAAVVVGHGFFSCKDGRSHRRLAEALAASADVVSMDFRGHGRSGGWYTFSAREGADLDAVLDWAAARYARLALIGFSLGGAVALTSAARHRARLRGVAAVSAPSEFRRIEYKFWTRRAIVGGFRSLGPGSGCRPGNIFLRKPRPVDAIALLDGLPVLLVHGTEDPIVGLAHSQRLYEAAREPKRLAVIRGGGHAEWLIREDLGGLGALLREWIDATLR